LRRDHHGHAHRVVTDDDLVTGFSKHQVVPFIAAIAEQIGRRRNPSP